jgi:hypothetical protein
MKLGKFIFLEAYYQTNVNWFDEPEYYTEEEESKVKTVVDGIANLQTVEQITGWLDSNGFQYIDQGSSRTVYVVDQDWVIKIAKNNAGLNQNHKEFSITHNRDTRYLAASNIVSHDDLLWMVVQRLTPMQSEEEFAEEVGMDMSTFFDVVDESRRDRGASIEQIVCNMYGRDKSPEELQKEYDETEEEYHDEISDKDCSDVDVKFFTKNRTLNEFLNLIATYDLGLGDLRRVEHWAKGPKILDLGWSGGFGDD